MSGRSWPVVVRARGGFDTRADPTPAGEPVEMSRVNDGGGVSYIIRCPHCGVGGYLEAGRWEFTGSEDALTARPSILCNSTARTDGPNGRCGGHYWLTDGVLVET